MSDNGLTRLIGSRILSEANDLKRTVDALATELDLEFELVQRVVCGDCDLSETYQVVDLMGKRYPIDVSDLYLGEDDCTRGVRIMRESESRESARIFDRLDRNGQRTPYYDYRDTAMSKSGPFKPEWIEELRVVNDSDPNNPDVAYNNGHFLHQMTFFVGPVNFYWEVNGQKYCQEMNTGDSNYITPFWPHSFTSRNKDELALILAVTYGGDVRRSLKEFYGLGDQGIRAFCLDYRNHSRGTTQLIRQHMANENMTVDQLKRMAELKGIALDVDGMLNEERSKSFEELQSLSKCLGIELGDLLIPEFAAEEEVVVKTKSDQDSYYFPGDSEQQFRICPLARSSKMPLMKGSDIEVLDNAGSLETPFLSSLHSYIYNYGSEVAGFLWEHEGEVFEDRLAPGDSAYLKPYVRHSFANLDSGNARLISIRVSGAINLSAQKELSYFADVGRIIESECWFD